MSGTAIAYAARRCYTMSGIDIAYAATRSLAWCRGPLRTDGAAYGPLSAYARAMRCPRMVPYRYAMSRTDIAWCCRPTRALCDVRYYLRCLCGTESAYDVWYYFRGRACAACGTESVYGVWQRLLYAAKVDLAIVLAVVLQPPMLLRTRYDTLLCSYAATDPLCHTSIS
eukprot:1063023-Rhodomonas_salina.2